MNHAPHWLQGNLDLVSFIYGATFVLLGTVILSQSARTGDFKLRNILWLLAAFGLTNGLTEWFATWSLVKGDSIAQASVRVMALVVSYLFLFEFGRRLVLVSLDQEDATKQPAHALGLWLYLPIILPTLGIALLSDSAVANTEIWMRYCVGFLASGLTAVGFWLYREENSEALADIGVRRYLALASIAMLVFGIVGLIGPRADFFPASWLNEHSFIEVFGLPVAAVRALLAVLLAVALGVIIFRFNHAARQSLQDRLTEANRRNRLILQSAGEGIIELDSRHRITFINPAGRNMLGYPEDELLGEPLAKVLESGDEDGNKSEILLACETQKPARGSRQYFWRKDGSSFPSDFTCTPVRKKGSLLCTVLTFNDISEHERLLRLLRDTQTLAKIGGWDYDLSSKRLSWTDEVYRIHELELGTPVSFDQSLDYYEPFAREKLQAAIRRTMERGDGFDLQLRLTTAAGRPIWVRTMGTPHRKNGRTTRISGTIQDVTQRKEAEIALRDTKEFYELILDTVPMRIAYVHKDGSLGYINRGYEEWFKIPRSELLGKTLKEVGSKGVYEKIKPQIREVLAGEPVSFENSVTRDGKTHDLQVEYLPHISRDEEVLGFFSVVQDVTHRRQLEAQLVQAQKMEAVGQLTGGVAHDFNNLLGIILGNLQLLARPLKDNRRLHKKIQTATRAAMRGADLTRRLLAFSRRQMLEPKILDLNSLVSGLDELLRRTLGGGIDIETVFADDLWATTIDRGQMENAILNLAINARDAMSDCGKLTLETKNVLLDEAYRNKHPEVIPGEYVMVSVSDTGCGMSKEVLNQVFEPFFTTKEVGKGSGLGLSMIYGFVEQSGGHVSIYSEEGQGTSVKLYFPRTKTEALPKIEETVINSFMPGGTETILVVEDEEDVRETVVALLQELGYKTLEAENGLKALELIQGPKDIHLLFTDIMMPGGMRGPVLAHQARELRPRLKVLFTSGYAESAIIHRGVLVGDSDFIDKPYRHEELALKIRLMLDQEDADASQPQSSVGH